MSEEKQLMDELGTAAAQGDISKFLEAEKPVLEAMESGKTAIELQGYVRAMRNYMSDETDLKSPLARASALNAHNAAQFPSGVTSTPQDAKNSPPADKINEIMDRFIHNRAKAIECVC